MLDQQNRHAGQKPPLLIAPLPQPRKVTVDAVYVPDIGVAGVLDDPVQLAAPPCAGFTNWTGNT
jgi:hypothetical protein